MKGRDKGHFHWFHYPSAERKNMQAASTRQQPEKGKPPKKKRAWKNEERAWNPTRVPGRCRKGGKFISRIATKIAHRLNKITEGDVPDTSPLSSSSSREKDPTIPQ